MDVSICMAAYNQGEQLAKVLDSIRGQEPESSYEVIVCDDGSSDDTGAVCEHYGVTYAYLDRPFYANPARARNVAYRLATGRVIVAQSAETVHMSEGSIDRLARVAPGTFNVATVYELSPHGAIISQYTGKQCQRPFFFLGSVLRADLYGVGCDDDDFVLPGFDDDWLAARLMRGARLSPVFREDVVGHHLHHWRPPHREAMEWFIPARDLYHKKMAEAEKTGNWVAAGGPWPLEVSV